MDNPPAGEDASAEDIAALKQAEKERKIQKEEAGKKAAADAKVQEEATKQAESAKAQEEAEKQAQAAAAAAAENDSPPAIPEDLQKYDGVQNM